MVRFRVRIRLYLWLGFALGLGLCYWNCTIIFNTTSFQYNISLYKYGYISSFNKISSLTSNLCIRRDPSVLRSDIVPSTATKGV